MTEAVLVLVYLTALIVGSLVLHRRFSCIAAAFLAGLISAFLTTSSFVASEVRGASASDYLGTFWWGGIGLWIVSSIISGFIGLPIQRKKSRDEKSA